MTPGLAIALVASASLAAFGQIVLKLGVAGRLDPVAMINPTVLAGLSMYAVGMVLWLFALARLPLYVVYPFTLVTLALVFASSILILGERPSAIVIAGWLVIGIGVSLVAYGAQA